MSKHTPGPWVADIKADGFTEVWNNDYSMFIAKRHPMNDRDEAKANAALIASAPDLLESLEQVADYLSSGVPVYAGSLLHEEIRAAIAKARGE
jgi:hypothetical protein